MSCASILQPSWSAKCPRNALILRRMSVSGDRIMRCSQSQHANAWYRRCPHHPVHDLHCNTRRTLRQPGLRVNTGHPISRTEPLLLGLCRRFPLQVQRCFSYTAEERSQTLQHAWALRFGTCFRPALFAAGLGSNAHDFCNAVLCTLAAKRADCHRFRKAQQPDAVFHRKTPV